MELVIQFDQDGLSQNLEVLDLGAGFFRLEETPFFVESAARLGDLVELEALPSGDYRFVRVVEAAPGARHDMILPGYLPVQLEALSDAAERRGVKWELIFGGCLTLHLPPGVGAEAVDQILGEFNRARPPD